MAPQTSKSNHVEEEEEKLQAVILADSYNSRFKPLTVNTSRCLLPLCNQTLLDWTLECLVSSGVQEIFVFCSAHSEKVEAAIKRSKWYRPGSGIDIKCIVSKEARSVGDALRDMDARQLLTGDFILITGDVVSTLSLENVLQAHNERRKVSKDPIMTMVFREAGSRDRVKPGMDKSVLLLDSKTSECIHYEYVPADKSTFELPREIMSKRPNLDVRVDLVDCSIDICTVDVPALFTENFDYQDLRNDFVKGVLTSDLLTKTIFCHVVERGYATRVKDTKTYAIVSKDVLCRRTFPLVPDADSLNYELRRGHVYVASDGVLFSRTSRVSNHSIVGPGSRVFDDAQVIGSVVGSDCVIGRNTVIRNSYIWDGANVGAGCVVEESIIGENVKLLDGTKVRRGCLVSEGAVLGPSVDVGEFRRISKTKPVDEDEDDEDDEDEEEDGEQADASIVGQEAEAYLWPEGDNDDDEEEEGGDRESKQSIKRGRLGVHDSDEEVEVGVDDAGSDTSGSESSTASESESEESESESASASGSPTSFTLSRSGSDIPSLSLDTSISDFRAECVQSLERAFTEGHTVENAAIELKTLRMATNVPLKLVKEVVASFMIQRIKWDPQNPTGNTRAVDVIVARWGGLIQGLGGDDPVETLLIFQKDCESHEGGSRLFAAILKSLYNNDIIDEGGIKQWVLHPESKGETGSVRAACRVMGLTLLNALRESDDDETESEDEEGEDEGSE